MRWLSSLITALVLVVIPVSGAAGHAGLAATTPEDGANLEVAPEEVVLTFTEELLTDLVEVSVLDADDNPVIVTEVPQTPPPGTDVKLPWPADLPPGEYSVAFRVVSADGHPVTGRITFAYAVQREVAESASPRPEAAVTESASPADTSPDAEPVPVVESADVEVVEVVASEQSSNSLIGPILLGAAVIVGIGVVVSIVMLARSRQ